MKLIVADTGALISLGLVGQIELLYKIFGGFYIAQAVWEELQHYENPAFDVSILEDLESRVVKIQSENSLSLIMDYGESESVILYQELAADFLLIDDRKARMIAESLDVICIGSIGVLIRAKQMGLIPLVRPVFEKWLAAGRYFSVFLLNTILADLNEVALDEQ